MDFLNLSSRARFAAATPWDPLFADFFFNWPSCPPLYIGTVESEAQTCEAVVSTVFGAYYDVLLLPGYNPVRARLRGKLRIAGRKQEETWDHIPERHPIMVGDHVQCRITGSEATIESLLPRRNSLVRASRYEQQGLGANLDRALIVMSLVQPPASAGFIDRFLASCYEGGVPALILFTKLDLAQASQPGASELLQVYKELGYPSFGLNLLQEDGPEWSELKERISSGVTLFAGRSGTGKSTLLNRLLGGNAFATGGVSLSTGKGKHTTTNSTMVQDPDSGALYVDTPGVKEWGILHISRRNTYESFPELRGKPCRYRECDHSPGTEGCGVQEAIHQGRLSPERLQSLEAMLSSAELSDRLRKGDFIKATGRMRPGSKYSLKNQPPGHR
jgi:ribosome biogenesis GTPase